MPRFHARAGFIVILILLLLSATRSFAVGGSFTESFGTTQYKSIFTTAEWDTTAGELRLFPFEPSLVGTHDTPSAARNVVVAGNHAFIADDTSGLQILDISDPTNLILVGSYDTPGVAFGAALAGKFAFVADGPNGLQVMDISNLSSPTLIGTYNSPGQAFGVAVDGDRAFLADGFSGLQVFSIVDPTNPILTGGYDTPDVAYNVTVVGGFALIADGDSGLLVVDVSDSTNTTLAGIYNTPGYAYDVAVDGDLAFVADGASGLMVIDISNRTNLILVGSYDTPGVAYGVAVAGDLAFVADESAGLQVIDISEPTSPSLAESYDTPGWANNVAVAGNRAFVADFGSGLQVIKVSEPANPALVGSYDTPANVYGVTVAGDLALAADGGLGLQVIDISDPTIPTLVGTYDTPGSARGVAVDGDLVFIADYGSGLQLIAISDPANPILVGTYDTTGNAHSVAVAGDLAFLSDGYSGLQVIDISHPDIPILIGTNDTPGYAYDVVVAGDLAYVADYTNGLQVIDISDPTNPTTVGVYNTPGNARGVAMSGNLVFVADGPGGFMVINTFDHSVGTYDSLGNSYDVAVAGDLAFVVDGNSGGLHVIDISNPTNPTLVSAYGSLGVSYGVTVAGAFAFATDRVSGVQLIQVFQHEVNTSDNIGQSVARDGIVDTIVRARLSSTQTAGVSLELSADGGSNFQAVAPDSGWIAFAFPGTDILWRSTHTWAAPGVNAAVSEVTIEWLNQFALITSITDIPNDQGKQVSLEWSRSGHDFVGDSSQIAEYAVYRKIDPNLAATRLSTTMQLFDDLSPSARENALIMQTEGWHFLAAVPVLVEDRYAIVVPTLADSTIVAGEYQSIFRVTALTATPGVFFHSPPDSGYSVDNLAPGVPTGITVAYQPDATTLDWTDVPESDLQYYRVYRDTDPGFDPLPANLVKQVANSTWTDPSSNPWSYHYKISAVDFAGNEGEAGSAAVVTDTPTPGAALRFALHEAVPNPFNPSTAISYSIPAPGKVRLVIYNVAGREVLTLVAEVQREGTHMVRWDGLDKAGRKAASGVYLYELRVGTLVERKRMVLLK